MGDHFSCCDIHFSQHGRCFAKVDFGYLVIAITVLGIVHLSSNFSVYTYVCKRSKSL